MEIKPANDSARVGHETHDVSVRALIYFGVVLFLVLALTLISMRWMFFYFEKTQRLGPPTTPFEDVRTLPPTPRLQVEPEEDLASYRGVQEQVLKSYGWVDKTNGVVRIPINRAMTLLLERGLPVRQQGPESNAASTGAGSREGEPAAGTPQASRREK